MDFESRLQRFYEQFLAAGMYCADVGAHVGRHGLEMLRLVGPSGRVLLFEPLPDLYTKLKTILQSEHPVSDVEVFPYALSDETGETEFCVAVDALAYSGIKERRYDSETQVVRINVEVRRLDDIIGDWPRLDYIKIDTEGAEWNVIKGAAHSIERFRPVISFEFGESSYAVYGVSPGAVYDFFVANKYLIFDILGRQLERHAFVESSKHQAVWDYIALPNERRSLGSNLVLDDVD
jgi:FkbM family methyltransferase